jgi:hypothetical protein
VFHEIRLALTHVNLPRVKSRVAGTLRWTRIEEYGHASRGFAFGSDEPGRVVAFIDGTTIARSRGTLSWPRRPNPLEAIDHPDLY